MAKNDKVPDVKGDRLFHVRVLEMHRVEAALHRGDYVDGPGLAAALRQLDGKPVPPNVLEYLCRYLEGKITKPRGRKPIPIAEQRRQQMLVRYSYRRYYAWLKEREKRYGRLDGWPLIRTASWWQGPPHERAARMAAHRWSYGAESWRSVNNRVSSQK